MYSKYRPIIVFILFIVFSIVFSSAGDFVLLNVFFIIICSVFLFFDKNLLILFYIVLLPTNGLYSTEHNILGLFSPLTTVNLFTFFALYSEAKKNYKPINEYQKIAILIILSIIIYTTYSEFKNAYYDIYDMNYDTAIRRVPKTIFRYGTLILLIITIYNGKIFKTVDLSIKIGAIFLVVSTIFTNTLIDMGFEAMAKSEFISGNIDRNSGFFGWGDANSLAGFLVILTAYFLVKYKFGNAEYFDYAAIVFCIVGIFVAGSRTAFVGLFFVGIYFLLAGQGKVKSLLIISFLLLFVLILLEQQLNDLLFRFTLAGRELDVTDKSSRVWKWLEYIYYMYENKSTLIFGTTQDFWLNFGRGFYQRRVAHNLYITIVFQAGFLPLVILLYSYFKTIALLKINHWLLLLFIPMFMISFYVSDYGYLHYYVICLPLLFIFVQNNDESKNVKTISNQRKKFE